MEQGRDETAGLADLLQVVFSDSDSEDELIDDDPVFEKPSSSDSDTSDSDDGLFHRTYNRQSVCSGQQPDYYVSRNGKIKWHKRCPVYNGVGIKSTDIDSSEFGVKAFAQNVTTPFEIFSLFFDDQVLNLIVKHTNNYIRRVCKKYHRNSDSKEISRDELSAFIGLFLYTGIMKLSYGHIKDLWALDGTGLDIFRMTMGLSRFQFIMRCLRFDDFESRRFTMKRDKLTPVKELMSLIHSNFKKVYNPGRSVTVYQHSIPFRGRCSFKQYNFENPKKYGINIACVIDSWSSYFLSCEITTNSYRNRDDTSSNVVQRLVNDFNESYRDVITTESYTSVNLALALKLNGLSLAGRVSKSDKNVPRIFRNPRKPVTSSLNGFTEDLSLISYVPERNKISVYLSNRVQDRIDDVNSTKPEIIKAVEDSRKNVEDLHQNILNFGVDRRTRRWPLLVFFHFLNMAVMNSQTVLAENTGNSLPKFEFIKQLSLSMIRRQMERRSEAGYLPKDMRKRIRMSVDTPAMMTTQCQSIGPSKGRCYVCTRVKDKKSSTKCHKCHLFICKEHSIVTCVCCSQCGRE